MLSFKAILSVLLVALVHTVITSAMPAVGVLPSVGANYCMDSRSFMPLLRY